MAVRSLLLNLKRAKIGLESKNHPWSSICYYHRGSQPDHGVEEYIEKKLATEILMLKYPSGCATTVIQNWSDNGFRVSFLGLRSFSAKLMMYKRYIHSLQVMNWLESQSTFQMSPADHATKTELLIEVEGPSKAEEYFEKLPDSASRKAASSPLLHGYVRARETERAEALMAKLNRSGLVLSPHLYNKMMNLYASTSEFKKVYLVINEMKRNDIPLNVRSYNIWMNAAWEISGIGSVEAIYAEMSRDDHVTIGWSTLSTIANVFIKSGHVEQARSALESAEKKLSDSGRIGYLVLMTQHAALGSRDGVVRLWEKSKAVRGRIYCANYMSAILCLVKLGEIGRAERVFVEWESGRDSYDIRVSNVLLGAYTRLGLMERAEALHLRTLEGGGSPNYKTWEILAEGWLRAGDVERAIPAAMRALSMAKGCRWRPSDWVVMSIAEWYEKRGDVEGADWYVGKVRHSGFASLALYKLALRAHRCAQRPAIGIVRMMEKDGVELDDEARDLIRDIVGVAEHGEKVWSPMGEKV